MTFFRWQVIHHSECSAHCGQGVRNVTKQCIQQSLQEPSVSVPVDDYFCGHLKDLPPETEPCMGSCNKTHWQFLPWSQVKLDNNHSFRFNMFLLLLSDFVGKQCSQSCGGGFQSRKAHCVDLSGRMIADQHCAAEEKIVRQACHIENCPRWEVGEWTPVSLFILNYRKPLDCLFVRVSVDIIYRS